MKILSSLQRIVDLYFKNFLVIFISTLLTIILSCLSFGILAGPLLGGLILICLQLLHGEKADFKEIFRHFDRFLPTVILIIFSVLAWFLISIIRAIPLIGPVFLLAVGPSLSLIIALAITFVIKQNLEPIAALKRSVQSFLTDPLMVWAYSLVIAIISSLGAFLFIFPFVFTAPLGVIGAALAYQELSVLTPKTVILKKKEIQAGLIVLAGLLIIGIFCMTLDLRPTFFGRTITNRPKQSLSEKLTGKVLSSVTGEKVQIGRDSSSITVGGITFGEKLPKDYPRDIPIYPKAKIEAYLGAVNGDNSQATFSTLDKSELVEEYYQRELIRQGWEVENSSFGELVFILFKKGDERSGSVSITGTEDETTFILALKKE